MNNVSSAVGSKLVDKIQHDGTGRLALKGDLQ
jgi:hypothetical protein